MAKYVINGGRRLEGTVTISGGKNAAVAILPAALLVSGKCRVENVPDISDVRILLDILADMGAEITYEEPSTVILDCTNVQSTHPNPELVRKMPAAVILPPVPSTSTSRASGLWAPRFSRPRIMCT